MRTRGFQLWFLASATPYSSSGIVQEERGLKMGHLVNENLPAAFPPSRSRRLAEKRREEEGVRPIPTGVKGPLNRRNWDNLTLVFVLVCPLWRKTD